MTRKFNTDYGVYVCGHVFRGTRPALLVARDPDGYWQFLCGESGCIEENDIHLVGVGHLLARDQSLERAAALEPRQYCERKNVSSPWDFGTISDQA